MLLMCSREPAPVSAATASPYLFGVLMANETYLHSDYAAGVRLAVIGIHWDKYEPAPDVFDTHYRDEMMDKIAAYRKAGYQISLGTATQYTPAWIVKDPALQQQSQFPGDTSGMANLFYDQQVRDYAERFIADVVQHAGPVTYYRVGLSHNGETVMPRAPRGEWWAMDPKAQGDIAGRPATIPDPPFKHWYPGLPLDGKPATIPQLKTWWDWYFNALVDGHDWEIAAIRRAGFKGVIHIVMPGPAIRPLQMERYFQKRLEFDPKDTYHLMNVAANWYLLLDRLKNRDNLMIDISSVYDTSGTPRGNGCEAGDDAVDYLHDPIVETWSSTRWISVNAKRNGFPTIGENPGFDDVSTMTNAIRLMQQCHLTGIQWAFDVQLHTPGDTLKHPDSGSSSGSWATIDDYAHFIHTINSR